MITYKVVKRVNSDFLDGFNRYSNITSLLHKERNSYIEKTVDYTEDWNTEELSETTAKIRKFHSEGSTVIGAYYKHQVVGFVLFDSLSIIGETTMPFLHVSSNHRGKGIGSKLFSIAGVYALRNGSNTLYVSSHPSTRTVYFYKSMGCIVSKDIHTFLSQKEPDDIQLEYKLDYAAIMFKLVKIEFAKYQRVTALVITKTANTTFKYLPLDDDLFVRIVRKFIKSVQEYSLFKDIENIISGG